MDNKELENRIKLLESRVTLLEAENTLLKKIKVDQINFMMENQP